MGPVRQNPIQRTVSLFICVCTVQFTVYNCCTQYCTERSLPDNFPSCPPDNHHCSDDVYLRERGWTKSEGSGITFVPSSAHVCKSGALYMQALCIVHIYIFIKCVGLSHVSQSTQISVRKIIVINFISFRLFFTARRCASAVYPMALCSSVRWRYFTRESESACGL